MEKDFAATWTRGCLGEHVQFIHLLLLPLHLLWPSHLLLELCETLALAIGAIPLYRMAVRHSRSTTAGKAMVAAYLCYFPMQFLDIAIDLKTLRPISFGVPCLLFALEAIELKRWKTAALLLLLTLSAKEDYALILGPLGLWIAWQQWHEFRDLCVTKEIEFVIEPHIRFAGETGEQATMFFLDPSGNALEFKAFKDPESLFAS